MQLMFFLFIPIVFDQNIDKKFLEIKGNFHLSDKELLSKNIKIINDYFKDNKNIEINKKMVLNSILEETYKTLSMSKKEYDLMIDDLNYIKSKFALEDASLLPEIELRLNRIKAKFGKNSFYYLNLVKIDLYVFITSVKINDKNNNKLDKLNKHLDEINSSNWKNHPETSFILAFYCIVFESQSDYEKLLIYSKELMNLLDKDYPHDQSLFYNLYWFYFKSLLKLNKKDEALKYFQSISDKINNEEKSFSLVFFNIYLTAFEMYCLLKDKSEADKYLKKSIEKLNIFYNANTILYKKEAKFLYDLLIKFGYKKLARQIAVDYDLKN